MLLGKIQTIMTGTAVPFTRPETFSGIDKRPRTGSVRVGFEGLEGDEQGDRRVHGGPDKAVHHYPYEHYHHWRKTFGDRPLLSAPGAFGENLSTIGLTEENICMGDILSCGTTVLRFRRLASPAGSSMIGLAPRAQHSKCSVAAKLAGTTECLSRASSKPARR